MYEVKRTDKEIKDLLDCCFEQERKGGSVFPEMSFERGIRETLEWLCGEGEHPLGWERIDHDL